MKQTYWFKRKRYGYGWTPATWQGWVTFLVFVALIVGNWMIRYQSQAVNISNTDGIQFVIETFVLVSILIYICMRTGESPRWQWGKRKE